MLFMSIFTWEPEQRNEIIKRRMQGSALPEGVKAIGEWVELGGGRSFRLIDIPDAKLALAGALPWTDIGYLEMIPVMDSEEAVKLAAQGQQ
ncbi:MAG: DUF3303 family protein [Desulfobacteraceae bacterium]|jgi:hypothetical protein